MKRRKVSTFITATGLILATASFVFILQYVAFEVSVNEFHENKDDIYRIISVNEKGEATSYMAPATAISAAEYLSTIKSGTRYADGICDGIVRVESKTNAEPSLFRENGCIYADQFFFNIFSFQVKYGRVSLENPKTVILTESTAIKLFGTVDVVGEQLVLFNQFGETDYSVTGIIEDINPASDLNFGMAFSFVTLENPANQNGNNWVDPLGMTNGFTQNFIQLESGVEASVVAGSLNDLKKSIAPNDPSVFELQKLSNIHLAPSLSYALPTSGNLVQVLLLTGVGIMIMLIGWANYINLSTAQGLERAKQVGIQQTSGATRYQLMGQFLMEAFLFTLISSVLAFTLVELLQSYFNLLVGKPLHIGILNQQIIWISGLIFFLLGTIAAGAYVAFILSSQKPSEILKGSRSGSLKGYHLRKILVVFQFSISMVLVVVTFVFNSQLSFMKTQNLGMKLEDRLVIRGPSITSEQTQSTDAFKNALESLPFVEKYAGSNSIPGNGYNFRADGIVGENLVPEADKLSYSMLIVDENYLNTYEINLETGRNFSETAINTGWGSDEVIVNETAASALGYQSADDALDKSVFWGDNEYKIVGVINDYHHASLQQLIEPMILLPQDSQGYFTLKLIDGNTSDQIATLKSTFLKYYPGNAFEYFFIEDNYDRQYSAEQQFENLFWVASLLAIFIACLGLFGLAAYTASSRTKEIGVRKVLGATITDITLLLTRDFVKLVLLGFVIGSPIAWLLVRNWLTNFAYSIDLGPGIFLKAGFTTLIIALFTVSYQAMKSAIANPVESLKNE